MRCFSHFELCLRLVMVLGKVCLAELYLFCCAVHVFWFRNLLRFALTISLPIMRFVFFPPFFAYTGSADILFHEITSMLRLAGATQFCYIRLGSCGGVGVDAGSLIVTDKVVNGEGKSLMTSIVLGKRQEYPAAVCPALSARLQRVAEAMYGPAAVHKGTTMTCDSFYTEQGRMDGAFCGYTQDEQWRFLARCRDELMVRNFEMEALCLASFCTRAQIPCAVVCAALVNRMAEKGVDSPTAADVVLKEWEERPVMVAVRFVIDALKGAAGQG